MVLAKQILQKEHCPEKSVSENCYEANKSCEGALSKKRVADSGIGQTTPAIKTLSRNVFMEYDIELNCARSRLLLLLI